MKTHLAARYDFSVEALFKAIDDWNYRYIDSTNLKRFFVKCGVVPSAALLTAVLRRLDVDAD